MAGKRDGGVTDGPGVVDAEDGDGVEGVVAAESVRC
jgi:hypothetical protein